MYDNDIIEAAGLTFRVNFTHDQDAGRPWENSDGHGPVREVGKNYTGHLDKRPGERPLYVGDRNEYSWAYDWQAACRMARKDGWNAEPFDAPGRIERAVQADFDYLRAWCENRWHYVGVIVTLVEQDEDGDTVDGPSDSLWGVETWKGYHETTAREIADAMAARILSERAERDAEEQTETAEASYWAERDVMTKGA